MYDFPWLHAANDALWQGLAHRLRRAGFEDLPGSPDRNRPLLAQWRDPDLLLSHTCGYPLRTQLRDRVRVVATPCYATDFTHGADHRSVLIVPRDAPWQRLPELRGRIAAINGYDSNSGMNLFRAAIAPHAGGQPFFARVLETGAHWDSIAAVAQRRADIAAIDGVTYHLIRRHRPAHLRDIRILGTTADSPGLPLITRAGTDEKDIEPLRDALLGIAADPALTKARDALSLTGFVVLPDTAYERVSDLERQAVEAGYPVLA